MKKVYKWILIFIPLIVISCQDNVVDTIDNGKVMRPVQKKMISEDSQIKVLNWLSKQIFKEGGKSSLLEEFEDNDRVSFSKALAIFDKEKQEQNSKESLEAQQRIEKENLYYKSFLKNSDFTYYKPSIGNKERDFIIAFVPQYEKKSYLLGINSLGKTIMIPSNTSPDYPVLLLNSVAGTTHELNSDLTIKAKEKLREYIKNNTNANTNKVREEFLRSKEDLPHHIRDRKINWYTPLPFINNSGIQRHL